MTHSPSTDYRERLYRGYFSTSYGVANSASEAHYAAAGKVLARVLGPHLPAARDAVIVDVACGIGYAVDALTRSGYANVSGVDVSPDQVAVAQSRGLRVEQVDVFEYLSGRHSEFDTILALDFMEHLRRDELLAFLDLCREALRPGGRLVVKTPNASSPIGPRARYRDLTHELVFTEQSLRQAFLTCGLRPVVICGEQIRPTTVKGWIRWVPARVGRLLWKAYLIAELSEEGFGIPTEFNLIGVAEPT